jgi:hypothetical protein
MPANQNGDDHSLIPHPGDLSSVEGSLTLASGPIDVQWEKHPETSTFSMQVGNGGAISGLVGVPTFGQRARVLFDEKVVWDGCSATRPKFNAGLFTSVAYDGHYVYFDGVRGSHTFESASGCD